MGLYYFLIIYILVLAIILSSGNCSRNKSKIYIILTFSLFAMIAALRGPNVGNDTLEYLNLYKKIQLTGDISNLTWRYEIGYLYLNKLLSRLFLNTQAILVVTSLFIMFGYARFIYKYSQFTWLSVYLFFTFRFFDMTMVVIRLNIAIVLILFAYDYLRERKLIKFIVIVLLAFLFHRTAIVFLLAWPITKLKFNYKTISLTFFSSLIFYVGFGIVLKLLLRIFPTYSYYLESSYLNGEIRLASIMNLLISLIILLFGMITYYQNKNKIKTLKDSSSKNFNFDKKKGCINDNEFMLLMILISVSVNFIALRFNLLDRVNFYFQVFTIIYLPNAINSLKDRKLVVLIVFIVIVMFFIYSTSISVMRPEWNGIYPYSFY